jgi:hypothetical protein
LGQKAELSRNYDRERMGMLSSSATCTVTLALSKYGLRMTWSFRLNGDLICWYKEEEEGCQGLPEQDCSCSVLSVVAPRVTAILNKHAYSHTGFQMNAATSPEAPPINAQIGTAPAAAGEERTAGVAWADVELGVDAVQLEAPDSEAGKA